jgi:hypothetical protein
MESRLGVIVDFNFEYGVLFAWPAECSFGKLDAQQDDVAIEELAYERLEM